MEVKIRYCILTTASANFVKPKGLMCCVTFTSDTLRFLSETNSDRCLITVATNDCFIIGNLVLYSINIFLHKMLVITLNNSPLTYNDLLCNQKAFSKLSTLKLLNLSSRDLETSVYHKNIMNKLTIYLYSSQNIRCLGCLVLSACTCCTMHL